MRQLEVGLDFQGLAVMADGLVDLPAPGQGETQVVVGQHVVGFEFQGLAVMADGLVNLPAPGQREAQVVVGQRTLCSTGQVAGPQRLAVLPIRGLTPGTGHEACRQQRAAGGIQPASKWPCAKKPFHSPTHPPDHGNAQADLRQIGVTIGPGMISDRHEPDHGQQRAEIPQPADQHGGLPAPRQHGGCGKKRQDQAGGARLPRRKGFETRIKGRQPQGPEELAEIDGVGNHRVGDPRGNRHAFQRGDVAGLAQDRRHGARHATAKRGTFSSTNRKKVVDGGRWTVDKEEGLGTKDSGLGTKQRPPPLPSGQ